MERLYGIGWSVKWFKFHFKLLERIVLRMAIIVEVGVGSW